MKHSIHLNSKVRVFLAALFLLLIGGAAIAFYVIPKLPFVNVQDSTNYRALWAAKGIAHYQIDIVTESLPVAPVEWSLTIQNKQITQQSLVACDHPNQISPSENCAYIRQYYSWLGKYTVEQLFDLADQGLAATQMSLLKCNLLTGSNFTQFSTFDTLFSAAKTCQNYLQSSDVLYAVQYDADYGYPKSIASYMPGVEDGSSTIDVKSFRVIQ